MAQSPGLTMEPQILTDDPFRWVDDYIAHVGKHFEVRREDQLLIVMPNRAVKLNETGLRVLRFLKDGGSIFEVLAKLDADQKRRSDLFYFLCDFRSLMTGCLGEGRGRKAVDSSQHVHPFNLLPVLAEAALTYRCNLRCRFCYAGCTCQGPKEGSNQELTTNQVVRILNIIRNDARVPSVSFTGGEPTLRSDLVELTAEATRIGLRVNLITNGTLLAGPRRGFHSDKADALREAGLESAQVSLEGPNSEIHDNLTGVSGSFEKTLSGLAALRRAGIHVHTHTTINTVNAPHLKDLVRLISELGLRRLSMNMIVPAGTALDRSIQVSYRQIGELVEQVRVESRRLGVEFMWYSPTPMCIFNPLAFGLGNKSCAACDGLLSISPTGDVLPCSSYPEPVGNLLREPFESVWKAARSRFFREKKYAPTECADCEEFIACAGACPLYWSAMGTEELAPSSTGASKSVYHPNEGMITSSPGPTPSPAIAQ